MTTRNSLLQRIEIDTGIGSGELKSIIVTAPARYKQYFIPKRSGGQRLIAHPAQELKILQRYLLKHELLKFPVHVSATAYVKRKGILQNALIHRRSSVLLKLDFKEFFPSIKTMDWIRFLNKDRNKALYSKEDTLVLTNILFWGRKTTTPQCLSIGAPTSPMLSNIIMYDLDSQISQICQKNSILYTRYADDITLSADSIELLRHAEAKICNLISKTKSPLLTFNASKRGLYTRAKRRMVTGLIITPDHNVSLGRERKRLISVMVHKYTLNVITQEDFSKLRGLLAFAHAVEPTFVERLASKYGSATIHRITSLPINN